MATKLCNGFIKPIWETNPIADLNERLDWWDTMWGNIRQLGVKRKRLTCPKCGRKVMSSISVCQDGCHVIHSLPPHKPKGWWKKPKASKNEKTGRQIRRR